MVLRYQQQDCALTLREGVAEYHRYLAQIGRKAMVDSEGSRLILEHDTTRDLWYGYIAGAGGRTRYLAAVRMPVRMALPSWIHPIAGHKSFISGFDLGKRLAFISRLYWKCLGLKWRIVRRTRHMTNKWPFQFPEEWLDQPIATLREWHGIRVLTIGELATGDLIEWSGNY